MNVSFNSFPNYAISLFKESILPALTAQQKKILMIASLALGLLVAAYFVVRHSFKAEPKGLFDDVNPVLVLDYDEVIRRANRHFAANPNKAAILDRIEKKLQKVDYKNSIANGKKVKMTFRPEDQVDFYGGINNYNDQERDIVSNATKFLEELPTIEEHSYCD